MNNKSKIAVLSLVIGILSFVHFFGIEKAVIAIIAGWLGLREIFYEGKSGKKFAYAGIILGTAYIIVIAVIAVVKWPELLKSIKMIGG